MINLNQSTAPPPFARQEFAPTDRNPAVAAAVSRRVANLDQGSQFMVPGTRGVVLYPGMDGGAEWSGRGEVACPPLSSRPPWGTLTAIDLDRAEILWRIPLGDYPQLLASGEAGLGSENYGGPLVTAGDLLFIAATPDKLLKAYNKHTAELLWQAVLPAAGFATPITYAADGRQFVVIAAGGGKLGQASGSSYVAFALPGGSPVLR